jgi:hypothetical protein
MWNASLATRLEEACRSYEDGLLSAGHLASAVRLNGEAFEGLGFADLQAIRSIAWELDVESYYAEEGCSPTSAAGRLVGELRAILARAARA